jgi:hypothetical protein
MVSMSPALLYKDTIASPSLSVFPGCTFLCIWRPLQEWRGAWALWVIMSHGTLPVWVAEAEAGEAATQPSHLVSLGFPSIAVRAGGQGSCV